MANNELGLPRIPVLPIAQVEGLQAALDSKASSAADFPTTKSTKGLVTKLLTINSGATLYVPTGKQWRLTHLRGYPTNVSGPMVTINGITIAPYSYSSRNYCIFPRDTRLYLNGPSLTATSALFVLDDGPATGAVYTNWIDVGGISWWPYGGDFFWILSAGQTIVAGAYGAVNVIVEEIDAS